MRVDSCAHESLLLSQQPEHHPLRIDDDAGVPAPSASPDVTDGFRRAAGRHARSGDVADPDLVDSLAFAWLVFLVPGLFPGLVIDHPLESERLEPRRGPRGEVSAEVVAVDDHRPVAIQPGRGRRIQLLERDVDRPREVIVLALVFAQHVDLLRPLLEQLLDLGHGKDLCHPSNLRGASARPAQRARIRWFFGRCSTSARPMASMTGGTYMPNRPRKPFFSPYQPPTGFLGERAHASTVPSAAGFCSSALPSGIQSACCLSILCKSSRPRSW